MSIAWLMDKEKDFTPALPPKDPKDEKTSESKLVLRYPVFCEVMLTAEEHHDYNTHKRSIERIMMDRQTQFLD